MIHIGMKVKYLKNGALKTSQIESYCSHDGFIELFLRNGDAIIDSEIIT
jgi:hypothetical protein